MQQEKQDIVAASLASIPSQPQPRFFNIDGFSGTVSTSEDVDGNRVRTYRVGEEGTAPAAQVVNRGVSMPRRSIESVELLEAPGYVYRAGVSDNGEYWARDLGVAIAYRHNPGFGGGRIYRTKLPENLNILDLRRNDVHRQWLEETLGDDWMEHYETDAWATASRDAIERLEGDGYDGVMYLDDYPDGAETIFIPGGVTGDEIEVPLLEGLLFWKESGWDTRGYANNEITNYLIDKLYEKDSDTGEFELLAEKYAFGKNLVRRVVGDLSYDEFETLLNGGSVRYQGDEIVLSDGMVSSAPPPPLGRLASGRSG